MPALKALAAQIGGALAALAAALLWPSLMETPLALAFGQGVVAAATSVCLRADAWWPPIHFAFVPALVVTSRLDVPSGWFLAAFVTLLLVFWSTFRGQVPLYLSNRASAQAVLALLPRQNGIRLIDIGAGTGGLLQRLARGRPEAHFTGVEHAPLPFLIARYCCRGLPNCTVARGDFWRANWAGYDVVYAFLSPVAMDEVWNKAKSEMQPGSLLVSNSFPVAEAEPHKVVDVGDRRRTRLYCYIV